MHVLSTRTNIGGMKVAMEIFIRGTSVPRLSVFTPLAAHHSIRRWWGTVQQIIAKAWLILSL